MHDFGQKLQQNIDAQKNLLNQTEKLLQDINSDDIYRQNDEYKNELLKIRSEHSELRKKYVAGQNEISALRLALREQLLNEKLGIINATKRKVDAYFDKENDQYLTSLEAFKLNSTNRINAIISEAKRFKVTENDELLSEETKLKNLLNQKIEGLKADYFEKSKKLSEEIKNRAEILNQEPLSEEQIEKRIRQNNIETKIGSKFINWIGILIILIGVGTAMRYTYINVPDYFKAILSFLLGTAFLVAGELLNKRIKNIAALGITGGGIGILFYSIYSSYFMLKLINVPAALGLCVLVTAVAFILSLRYNSAIICGFALVGGFLPLTALNMEQSSIIVAMGYFFILNLLTLLISTKKDWLPNKIISFVLNIPVLVYLVFNINNTAISIVYSILTFAMYTTVTLSYSFIRKTVMDIWHVLLLSANTIISCIIIYWIMQTGGLSDFKGLLAIVFCLIYLFLGRLVNVKLKGEKATAWLFYLTSVTFAILAIPFQFGISYMSMGWLIEAILLIITGIMMKQKSYEYTGWVIYGICTLTFWFYDLFTYADNFQYRFLFYTAGTIAILIAYLYKDKIDGEFKLTISARMINWFKYYTLVAAWIYAGYQCVKIYSNFSVNDVNRHGYSTLIFAAISILLAVIYPRIKAIADKGTSIISTVLHAAGVILCISLNIFWEIGTSSPANIGGVLALLVLIVFNIVVLFSAREIIMLFVKNRRDSFELYPLIMSVYFLGVLTSILIVQFDLGGQNVLFSGIYVLASLVLIVYGFIKKLSFIRRFGLALSVISTAKLFIFDIALTNAKYRIISYFVFGLVLIGISLVYQKFSKQIVVKPTMEEIN